MIPFPNRLNELSAQNRVCKVFGIKVVTAVEVPAFAANAGFDGLFIDLEHSLLTLKTANELCVGALFAGISPFVRVPRECGPGFVQRVLDGGAQAVIFPHIDTVEQAKDAVKACKYPPLGKRSITGMLPNYGYKPVSISETTTQGNSDQSLVFAMIESPEGVSNVDAIAAVDGVDVIMVGTNDLSIELGVPGQWDCSTFLDAMSTISEAAKRWNRKLAIAGIYDRPDFIRKCVHEYGARWVVVQHDLSMMSQFMKSSVQDMLALEPTGDFDGPAK